MGLLVSGKWQDTWYDTGKTGGRFERTAARYRHWVTADGAAGPTGEAGFKAETDRYHLYVSLACPWAHRTLILRRLKSLEAHISVSVVHPLMLENGWSFADDFAGATGDTLYGLDYLHQLYTFSCPDYTGRVTVPVLWDKQRETIVSNESADIIRMLNSAFDGIGATPADYYPASLRADIDELNARIYDTVNNGVYKAGFATEQSAYDEAVTALFDSLDWLDAHLSRQRFLMGNRITEVDWRLFTTLVRFDAVYVTHFKCDRKRIGDYPQLSGYVRDLCSVSGVADTIDLSHIRHHYFRSHPTINPHRILSIGPQPEFHLPHDRERLGAIEES